MYQIDVASAASALPAAAAAGTPGFFTEGNPVTGVPATIVPADFLNMLMVELLTVVVAGGQAPTKGTNNQLLAAIKGLFSGNLAANGHLSIPVGTQTLILNWGSAVTTDNSGQVAVTFDLPFPNGALWSIANNKALSPPIAFHGTGNMTKSGMTVYSSSSSGTASASGTGSFWLALGF